MTEQLRGHVFPKWGPRGPFRVYSWLQATVTAPRAHDRSSDAGGRPSRASSHPHLGDRSAGAAGLHRHARLEQGWPRIEASDGKAEREQETETQRDPSSLLVAGRGRTVGVPPSPRRHGCRC